MSNDTRKRLFDALEACKAILDFTSGFDLARFSADKLLRSAVERQLEILGESLRRAQESSPELPAQLPDLPRIIGMRNRIVHGYDSVDEELVWDVVQFKIPSLAKAVEELLGSQAGES